MMKEPPKAIDAEKAVLGAILLDANCFNEVAPYITDDNVFYDDGNREIWKIFKQLNKDRIPIDLITAADVAKDRQTVTAYELTGLAGAAPATSNVHHYARIICEKYMMREIGKSSKEIEHASHMSNETAEDALKQHQKMLDDLIRIQPTKSRNLGNMIDGAVEQVKESRAVIPTGIKAVDSPSGGFTRKEITVLGGRPGHGKTTLMLNILAGLIKQGRKIMVFNREMSNDAMIEKLIVHQSSLSYSNLRHGNMDNKANEDLNDTIEKLKSGDFNKNLLMYDDIRDLDTTMREIYRHNPDVVIDDYVQLIKTEKREGRRFEIENILTEYKWMCKKVNCAALILSQLSREIEKRFDPEPRMSDFAESGVIEQIAENAMFVFYGYNFDHEEYSKYESKIMFAKSRYGSIGSYDVGFNGNRCKFYNTMPEAQNDELDN